MVDALSELGVDRLLKVINEAYITKSGDGSMDLELSNQFLYWAVTLMQGGELPSGSGLAVWIHKHLVKLQYKPCPCYLFCLAWVEDGVDPLGGPGACSSSLHVRQDEQDIAALIWELGVPHTEVKGAFCLEVVQVWVPENGEGATTLGGFRVGTGAALGWGGGGDRLQ